MNIKLVAIIILISCSLLILFHQSPHFFCLGYLEISHFGRWNTKNINTVVVVITDLHLQLCDMWQAHNFRKN